MDTYNSEEQRLPSLTNVEEPKFAPLTDTSNGKKVSQCIATDDENGSLSETKCSPPMFHEW